MPFIITPLKEKDTLEWCQAHYAAFAPLLGCLWKYPPTEETYAFMAQQRAVTLSDPHTHVMKVVETESGKIAGVATWKIYPHERTQKELEKSLEDGPYADDINIEARVAFMTNLYNKRKSTLGTRPCVLLGSLIVRPEFQRQGVGHLLMEWGCGEADK
jgi:GNAT superfamily N-acetyltransferase